MPHSFNKKILEKIKLKIFPLESMIYSGSIDNKVF